MVVLKLDRADEDKEIAFELDYLASLTTAQRFQLMQSKTQEMLRLRKKSNANRTITEVIKRKPR